MLTANPQKFDGSREFILKEERYNATNFFVLWNFEGVFKYSPLFYGWYTNGDSDGRGYKLSLAYFITGLVVYAYSFFATLRKMAENSRMSKLSEKDDECIFSWKLFTAWDYMIGNAETAHNRVASIVMGFKEALLEEAEKKRESKKWKVICIRALVNLAVLGLLTSSAYAVVIVVQRSIEKEKNDSIWRQNENAIVMSLITTFCPMLFELIGLLEQYHPRKQLRMQLARIMILNLLTLYSLIFALFVEINDKTSKIAKFGNISCTGSTEVLTPSPYSTSTADYSYSSDIFDDTRKLSPLASDNLIYDMGYNVSNITLPVRQYLDVFIKTLGNLTGVNDSAFTFNTTDYAENSSLVNITDILFKETVLNISHFNETIGNFSEYNLSDFKDILIDYLAYVLLGFNTSNTTDSDIVSTTESNTLNVTDGNDTIFVLDIFETVRSTLIPLINNISSETSTTTVSIYNTTTVPIRNNSTSGGYPICQTVPLVPATTAGTEIVGNDSICTQLRTICWETMFGQELIRLTVMDLLVTILSTLAMDLFRGIFIRVMNRCWCWDLEKTFPQYADFKVAENILHLVNNQGMVWMGMFFAPGLVVLNVIKLYIMMYFRSWVVLTCNVPHEVIFRASRSNNFYYALLLMMLFLCVLPVGYAIVRIKPSRYCGPFSKHKKIFDILTQTIKHIVPERFHSGLDYIASPGIIIPLLVLLILIIYYFISLTGALRETNEDLKIQLRRERTEERRKMFKIVDRRRGGSGESNELSNTPYTKWKKILGNQPSGKSFDDTPKQQSEDLPQPIREERIENKNKDFLTKFIKKALGKSSTSEEEQNAEDGTDTEQHDSLPYDTMVSKQIHKPVKPSLSWGNSEFSNIVSRAVKKNQRKLSNPPPESIDSVDTKLIPLQHRDTFEKKTKVSERVIPSTSKDTRQDSVTSVWSDNIPVITISKTDSAENILIKTSIEGSESSKFKPKVKCVLKKQSTEFDEDTICHFSKDLENNLNDKKFIKTVSEETFEPTVNEGEIERCVESDVEASVTSKIEKNSDHSSSEDTEFRESSVDTILNFPKNNDILSSSEDKTISDDSIDRYSYNS